MSLTLTDAQQTLAIANIKEALISEPVLLKTLSTPSERQVNAKTYKVHVPAGLERPKQISNGTISAKTDRTQTFVEVRPLIKEGYELDYDTMDLVGENSTEMATEVVDEISAAFGSGLVESMEFMHLVNMVAEAAGAAGVRYLDDRAGFTFNSLTNAHATLRTSLKGKQRGLTLWGYFLDPRPITQIQELRNMNTAATTQLLREGGFGEHMLGQWHGLNLLENYIDFSDADIDVQIFRALDIFQNGKRPDGAPEDERAITIGEAAYADSDALTAGFAAYEADNDVSPELAGLYHLKLGRVAMFYTNRAEAHHTAVTPTIGLKNPFDEIETTF